MAYTCIKRFNMNELNKVSSVYVVSKRSRKSKDSFRTYKRKEMVQGLKVAFGKFHLCNKLAQQNLVDLQFVNFW